jgi:UDP-N-acetylglucosamine 1-carboxyvinyltransferase
MFREEKYLDCIQILGGKPLYGSIKIQGSKNAVLPMIAATILNEGISILHNCPKIVDVMYMVQILKQIGCKVVWQEDTLMIDARQVTSYVIPKEHAGEMRSSVIMLGSLLGRLHRAVLPYPGGCVIGKRPIDMHLLALQKLNINIEDTQELLQAETKEIVGGVVHLPFPSVGATENVLLASVLAKGKTIIRNCAKEPEIEELCLFLQKMGAEISGIGTEELVVNGVEKLHDVEYYVVADRIVAGTYMLAAVATRGRIVIQNPPVNQLFALIEVLDKMGVFVYCNDKELLIDADLPLSPVDLVETKPYPGFPTDLQSQLIAVLTTIPGNSRIRENIFEERFKVAKQLNLMGAHILVRQKDASISGVSFLRGTTVVAEELRGGAALVIAALGASGMTFYQ